MENESEFYEPSNALNFLQRYHSAKDTKQSVESKSASPVLTDPTTAAAGKSSATSAPKMVQKKSTQDVWSSVFHPLGRSPTGKSQFDTAPPAGSGVSTSELYDRGASGTIHLDRKDE
mmetsp:Transcript_16977/g.36893  ORF Transcript_16977/g.36893 Transcript_16977/m.36893 type:complete len:117 (+) Transcript_16977:83-433(+)|eukprot:CAMPEP_0185847190 /NCGR_PEP_ID=MMETSP1354-20130828/2559_1 /TAXON_ID=708628 /ORGANISM="Erythrolobus madagascarensis, Strain CCMP3276" /LENGTH=116 /DNA_ID=CAMNT_0028547453 /DNA_START=64 /DNA_END=414 /DNA_ORIENTATION=-